MCISFLRSFIFLTFNQSFVCLAFISFTAVSLDAVGKREPGVPLVLPFDGCPKPSVGVCAELCSVGSRCSGGKICCFNGCGHECMSPGKYWICFSLTLQWKHWPTTLEPCSTLYFWYVQTPRWYGQHGMSPWCPYLSTVVNWTKGSQVSSSFP